MMSGSRYVLLNRCESVVTLTLTDTSAAKCSAAMAAYCGGETTAACERCAGNHQAALRRAGCASADVQRWCDAPRELATGGGGEIFMS
jgi:hypothetical protein